MKEKMKRLISVALSVLLLLPVLFTSAYAENQTGAAKRWNIMLVVDGSGSLFSGPTTDPDGLRYEAIDDLLGILQDNGNNVGAMVFSANPGRDDSDEGMRKGIRLNTGMISFDGKAPDGGDPKDYINSQLRNAPMDYGTGGTTDIGTALLVAEETLEALQKKNGLESIVFLFTDGVTELNYTNTYEKSIQNMHKAEQKMCENNIKLCGVFLNKDNRSNSTEVRDMVCAANGIASNTLELGDIYIEIADSASCHSAMEQFMRLLGYSTSDPIPVPGVISFRVPGTGAEEANIRIYSTNGDTLPKDLSVSITAPDGTVFSGATVEAICRSGRTFKNYKLVNPESGTWTIAVNTDDKDSVGVVCELVFTMDKEAAMETEPSASELHSNMEVKVTGYLTQNGVRVTDLSEYREYTCTLFLRDLATNEEISYEIQPDNRDQFSRMIQLDRYGNFEAFIEFTCDSICIQSEPEVWSLGNNVPAVYSDKLNIKYGLFLSDLYKYDLVDQISDREDGKDLAITVESSDCNMDAVTLEGTQLLIKSKDVGDGELIVTVEDSQGASGSASFAVSTKNITLLLILTIIAVLALAFVIVVLVMRNRPRLDGKCLLTVPYDGSNLEIALPAPGTQGSRSTSLSDLLEMEKGNGRAIRSACQDDDEYGQVLRLLDEEDFKKVKLSIVGGKTKNGEGKTIRMGKLKVAQGKKPSVIFNGSIKLTTINDGYYLAYYQESEEEDGDSGWGTPQKEDRGWDSGSGNSGSSWADDDTWL